MFRVAVIACNPEGVSLSMGDNIERGIKAVLFAEIGEKLDRRFVRPLDVLFRALGVVIDEVCSSLLLDGRGLRHFYADMGIFG